MGRRGQSYRMGKQELVTQAVGHGFKSPLCKLQGLKREKTNLWRAHREVTWSQRTGRAVDVPAPSCCRSRKASCR